eukprot:6266187-Prorocentrum_lima.AAC.1
MESQMGSVARWVAGPVLPSHPSIHRSFQSKCTRATACGQISGCGSWAGAQWRALCALEV